MRFVQPVITKRARRHQSYKRIKGCMLQAFTDERWWSAKRDRDTTSGRIWGSGREREAQESSEREHTHYLNARHSLCAFHATAPFLCTSYRSTLFLVPSLGLSCNHFLRIFHFSLSYTYFFPLSLPSAKCRVSRVLSNDCQVDNLRLFGARPRREERRRLDSSREEDVFKTKGIKPFRARARRTLRLSLMQTVKWRRRNRCGYETRDPRPTWFRSDGIW